MNSEGPQSEDGGSGIRRDDNVVRLPRDWLGPREDLVPFGPSAQNQPDRPPLDLPLTADAFWSESSASVHDALQASPSDPNGLGSAELGRPRGRFPARGRVLAGGWVPGRGRVPEGFTRAGAREAVRNPASWIALAAVAVLIVLGLTSSAGQKAGRQTLATAGTARPATESNAGSSLPTPGPGAGAPKDALHRHTRTASGKEASHRSADARARREAVRLKRRTAASRRSARPSAATVERVRYTHSIPPPAAPSSASPAVPPSSVPEPTATVASGGGARASEASKQPSLGANGTLGPGSSPDG